MQETRFLSPLRQCANYTKSFSRWRNLVTTTWVLPNGCVCLSFREVPGHDELVAQHAQGNAFSLPGLHSFWSHNEQAPRPVHFCANKLIFASYTCFLGLRLVTVSS